jgi:hypothetical protein
MKYIIILSLFLIGCAEPTSDVRTAVESNATAYRVVTVDGCEYISAIYFGSGISITHKENCKNHSK